MNDSESKSDSHSNNEPNIYAGPNTAPFLAAGADLGLTSSDKPQPTVSIESAQNATNAALIDRAVAPFGARKLVQGRPGMGWLLTEVSPAQLWCAITGALTLDGYNLVLYLTLLGASVANLAWLPLVNYGGFALSVLLLFLRPPSGDAKKLCVNYAFIARSLWLGVIAWPLLCLWLNWGTTIILTGVFATVFLTALFGNVSIAAFMTWTAAVVPREERGRFYMWRNLSAYGIVTLALQAVAWLWPVSADASVTNPQELPWLMGLITIATIIVILSTFPLSWSPAMPARDASHPPHGPLWKTLVALGGYRRLLMMGGLNTAAMACLLPYLPRFLHQLGMEGKQYALLQGNIQVPLMLAGIIVAGIALRRIGSAWLMRLSLFITVIGDGLFLFLTTSNLAWLALLCLGFVGLGRGLTSIGWIGRIQELAPSHDTRFPMLFLGINGVAGMATGLLLMAVVPWLEQRFLADASSIDPLWAIAAVGVSLRGVSFLIGLLPTRR